MILHNHEITNLPHTHDSRMSMCVSAGRKFVAKRYKKDPQGGWDMEEPGDGMSDAQRHAAKNMHMRLVKPYFQDCLMQEKAAEFGRAFNKVCGCVLVMFHGCFHVDAYARR